MGVVFAGSLALDATVAIGSVDDRTPPLPPFALRDRHEMRSQLVSGQPARLGRRQERRK